MREVDRDEPLVSYNSTVARNPASTMKVLTTYAALELLGPAYTWSTRAYATGPVRNGVLEGDLVLVGGGDPYLTTERWWAFVNGIRQTGIAKIRGNVVIDDSLFAPQSDDRAAFDSRPYRTYNVIPDALLVGFQTVAISAIPDATSGTVRATSAAVAREPHARQRAQVPGGALPARWRRGRDAGRTYGQSHQLCRAGAPRPAVR